MNKPRSRRNQPSEMRQQLRIIGGAWRGRKLAFEPIAGLRPTPDRVRETLFNWLRNDIHDSHCLDLFAGSGALGWEALSRGAASLTLIDESSTVIKHLKQQAVVLNTDKALIQQSNAMTWLQQGRDKAKPPFDIIFLDPPFQKELVQSCCQLLDRHDWIHTGSCIYIEMARDESLPELPSHWHLHREKLAGQVCYRLFLVV